MRHRELAAVLDRRDELAPDIEPLSLLAPALVDEVTEPATEHIAEQAAGEGRQAVQQHTRGAVGGENPAVIVDGQQAGAQRVQIFAAVVEGDQYVAAMLLAEQPVLDLGRGHRHQRLCVRLARHAIGRRVEDAGDLAVGREDRRRHAGQVVVAGEKVLAAVHDDRPLQIGRRAEPIGAADALGPDRARADAGGI